MRRVFNRSQKADHIRGKKSVLKSRPSIPKGQQRERKEELTAGVGDVKTHIFRKEFGFARY